MTTIRTQLCIRSRRHRSQRDCRSLRFSGYSIGLELLDLINVELSSNAGARIRKASRRDTRASRFSRSEIDDRSSRSRWKLARQVIVKRSCLLNRFSASLSAILFFHAIPFPFSLKGYLSRIFPLSFRSLKERHPIAQTTYIYHYVAPHRSFLLPIIEIQRHQDINLTFNFRSIESLNLKRI